MYQNIYDSLSRQHKALQLLEGLLQEEYAVLRQRDTNAIAALQFSIQELIRQIAVEKSSIVAELAGTRVLDYASMLPEEQGDALRAVYRAGNRPAGVPQRAVLPGPAGSEQPQPACADQPCGAASSGNLQPPRRAQ